MISPVRRMKRIIIFLFFYPLPLCADNSQIIEEAKRFAQTQLEGEIQEEVRRYGSGDELDEQSLSVPGYVGSRIQQGDYYHQREYLQQQAGASAARSNITALVRETHFNQPQLYPQHDVLFLFSENIARQASSNAGLQGQQQQMCSNRQVEISPAVYGEAQCQAYLQSQEQVCDKHLRIAVRRNYQPSCRIGEELLRTGQRGLRVGGRDYSIITAGVFCHAPESRQARLHLGVWVKNWGWTANTFLPADWNDWGGGGNLARWVSLLINIDSSFERNTVLYNSFREDDVSRRNTEGDRISIEGGCDRGGECLFTVSGHHRQRYWSNGERFRDYAGEVNLSFTLPKLIETVDVDESWQDECVALEARL